MVFQKNTILKELTVEDVFGEISFFTGLPRTVTAKSRNFSELMYLSDKEFLESIERKFKHTYQKFKRCQEKLLKAQSQDSALRYKYLFLDCYICQARGHIAIECQFLEEIQKKQLHKSALNPLHDHELYEEKEFMKQGQRIAELMRKSLTEVNVPLERITNEEVKHCRHQTDDMESPQNQDNESSETLKEVSINSSEWISERLYQISNNDSSDKQEKNSSDDESVNYRGKEINDTNSMRTDPVSCDEITSKEYSMNYKMQQEQGQDLTSVSQFSKNRQDTTQRVKERRGD